MHDQRHAHRFKTASCQFRAMGRGRCWHGVTVYVRKIDASLFEDAAVTQHPTPSAAARVTLPAIFDKLRTVNGGELLANGILQVQQELFYA